MASLYKRNRSPFWWIKCRDCKSHSPTFGKVIYFSTHLRIGVGPETRAARALNAEYALAEANSTKGSPIEPWANWVIDYLKVYCKSPATLKRYLTVWRSLSLFLVEKKIDVPRQLTREHCLAYYSWRLEPDKKIGKYRAVHNTAHMELKILGLIMAEAVRRNFAPFNPVRDLGVRRHGGRVKPEFTDEHLAFIASAIEKEPEPLRTFLSNSSAIAKFQGCRLNETHVDPRSVEFSEDGKKGLIHFRIKGGREHTAPLHPILIPLFLELRKAGATETYPRQANPSRKWFDFMKRIGLRKMLPGACFHCFRVTAVTKLARSRVVKEADAMRYIGHASTTVHRMYQRLRTEDLSDCMSALAPCEDKPSSPEIQDAPAASDEHQKEKNIVGV